MPEDTTTYDKGYAAGFVGGIVSSRLDSLEEHNKRANGHLEDLVNKFDSFMMVMQEIKMELARQAQLSISREQTVVSTAEAVEKERKATAATVEERRETLKESADTKWAPWAKGLAALAGAGTLIWIIVLVVNSIKPG